MYSESLKATLNCYRMSSMDSLGGPSGCSAVAAQMWFKVNDSIGTVMHYILAISKLYIVSLPLAF